MPLRHTQMVTIFGELLTAALVNARWPRCFCVSGYWTVKSRYSEDGAGTGGSGGARAKEAAEGWKRKLGTESQPSKQRLKQWDIVFLLYTDGSTVSLLRSETPLPVCGYAWQVFYSWPKITRVCLLSTMRHIIFIIYLCVSLTANTMFSLSINLTAIFVIYLLFTWPLKCIIILCQHVLIAFFSNHHY